MISLLSLFINNHTASMFLNLATLWIILYDMMKRGALTIFTVIGFYVRFEDDSVESAKMVKQWNVKIVSVS